MTQIEIRMTDPDEVDSAGAAAGRRCWTDCPVQVRDWRHANDVIIGVLQVQKDTMFIVLGMIVLVAAFNVVSSLIMLVKDKRADIAVLRTIGASSGSVHAHLHHVRRLRRRRRHRASAPSSAW